MLLQHLTWPGLIAGVKRTCNTYYLQKICKNIPNNFSHLPLKNIDEYNYQRTIYVDLVGLYKIKDGFIVDYKLQTIIMIDLAIGQFEIIETYAKIADYISKLLDRTQFSHSTTIFYF